MRILRGAQITIIIISVLYAIIVLIMIYNQNLDPLRQQRDANSREVFAPTKVDGLSASHLPQRRDCNEQR